jgi:hypothetical protein
MILLRGSGKLSKWMLTVRSLEPARRTWVAKDEMTGECSDELPHVSSRFSHLITPWPNARDFSERKWNIRRRKSQGQSFVSYLSLVPSAAKDVHPRRHQTETPVINYIATTAEQRSDICSDVFPSKLPVETVGLSSLSTSRLSIAALHIFQKPRHEQRSKQRLTTPHDDAAPEDIPDSQSRQSTCPLLLYDPFGRGR